MAIESITGKVGRFGRRSNSPRAATLPIGETDSNIFSCPACARPLGVGASRCAGCGTRLIAGVQAGRVVGFILIGLIAGTMVGSVTMALVSALSLPGAIAIAQPPAVVTPSLGPVASAPVPVVDPAIPASALSALRQSTVLNQRILADADRLTLALAATRPSGNEIAPVLRSLASTAAFGSGVAPDISDWDDGAAVSADLVALYDTVRSIAAAGLEASLSYPRAYINAAERMLVATAGIPELDAASRTLAATADIDLPSIDQSDPASAP